MLKRYPLIAMDHLLMLQCVKLFVNVSCVAKRYELKETRKYNEFTSLFL